MEFRFTQVESLSPEDIAELTELLADPVWRLCNLYEIKDKDGHFARFDPTDEQCEIINDIHIYGVRRLLILKARQLGMSTVIDLILIDMAIWNEGFDGAIVDQSQKKASIKLQNIIIGAFNSMPQWLRERFTVIKENTEEFTFMHRAADLACADVPKISIITASASSRGGTKQMLHISEWGPIQHEDPPRSDEILTGSIPSAERGIIAIETTWMGGKFGNLWDITKKAMETKKAHMTERDFKLYFFPWYGDKGYVLDGDFSQIPPEVHKYFAEVEKKIEVYAKRGLQKRHKFTDQQKLWYYKEAWSKGDKRFSEYPTVLDECFMAPVPGAIFSKMVDLARATGRVIDFPHSNSAPVFTFWDLGSPKNTRVIYVQFIGREIHFIDHDSIDLTPSERFTFMMAKGYNYGGHFLPHDAAAEEKSGDNFQQQLNKAGFTGIRIIPQCRKIWPGINHIHELSNRFVFHKTRCDQLLDSLSIYRTKKSTVDGTQTDVIVQGNECHDVDPVRMLAEAMLADMLKGYGGAIVQELVRGGGGAQKSSRQTKARAGRYGSSRR